MRLAVIVILSLLVEAYASPIIPVTFSTQSRSLSGRNDDSVLLVRRNKGSWMPYNELRNVSPHKQKNINVRVQPPPKAKKSVSRRVSSGVAKKPFLTFAMLGSGLLALNTYIVAEAVRQKEDKVMQIKTKKGELPVVIPDPPPLPKKKTASVPKKIDAQQQATSTKTSGSTAVTAGTIATTEGSADSKGQGTAQINPLMPASSA